MLFLYYNYSQINTWNIKKKPRSFVQRNVFELGKVPSVHLLWPVTMCHDPNLDCIDQIISQANEQD